MNDNSIVIEVETSEKPFLAALAKQGHPLEIVEAERFDGLKAVVDVIVALSPIVTPIIVNWLELAVREHRCVPDEKSGSELFYRILHAETASGNSFSAIISVMDDDWFELLNKEATELTNHCQSPEIIRRCFLSCDEWIESANTPEVEATLSWCRTNHRSDLDSWIVGRVYSPLSAEQVWTGIARLNRAAEQAEAEPKAQECLDGAIRELPEARHSAFASKNR